MARTACSPMLFRPGQTDVSVGVSDIHLNGGGLTLVPTVFCRRIKLYIGVAGVDGPAVLFYPAIREITDAHRLWTRCHPGSTQDALGALLGTTRAAALETLSNTCTTTELAGRLRTSLATASHHATVLRQAGLITTRRNGNAVLHLITPLGTASAQRWRQPVATAQVTGNGGCHQAGVVSSSIRSTHLTHQKPRRPGATSRSG